MEKNFKLTLEYDGTSYHGWQRQTKDPSIQDEVEKAIKKMTGSAVTLIGSGRTDAGVHALGQVANFHCDTQLTETDFLGGLNSLLPDDIIVTSCRKVEAAFHSRYDAINKTYEYRILNNVVPSAIHNRYSWFVRQPLDRTAMQKAISHLIGTHDFKAFEGAGSPSAHTVRCVETATLTEEEAFLYFRITANGFLRYMVRNIVGTSVDVGRGKISPERFSCILASRDRNRAGATAPPQGLFLISVSY